MLLKLLMANTDDLYNWLIYPKLWELDVNIKD